MADKRHRLQVDLSEDAHKRVEAMQKATRATTAAEVVRNALRLYEWFLEQKVRAQPQAVKILVDRGHGPVEVEILL